MNINLFAEKLVLAFATAGQLAVRLLPYVGLGALLGELLKLGRWTGFVEAACKRHPIPAILLATFIGIGSPLCTYGTIPIVVQLMQSGTPVFPLVSFLASSSLMNPQLLILTWRGIGLDMALARLLSVAVYSILLGLVLWRLPAHWIHEPQAASRVLPQTHRERAIPTLARFAVQVWRNFRFVAFYMTIGILAGAAIETFISSAWVLRLFDPGEWFALPLAAVLGVPLYACGGGTIPMIRSLLHSGMERGSALAFFLVGSATRPTPLVAMKTVLRARAIVAYVVSLLLFSVFAGWAFDRI